MYSHVCTSPHMIPAHQSLATPPTMRDLWDSHTSLVSVYYFKTFRAFFSVLLKAHLQPFATCISHFSLKLPCQLSFGPVCHPAVSLCWGCAGPLLSEHRFWLLQNIFMLEKGQSLALQCLPSPGWTCEHSSAAADELSVTVLCLWITNLT